MAEQATPGRIVVGTDGSAVSRAAVRWAAHEAHLRKAPVTVVRAWSAVPEDLAPYAPAEGRPSPEDELKRAEAELDTTIEVAFGPFPGVQVERRLVPGSPVKALLAAAHGADLLVLGGHRASSPFHHTLGTVTAACLRRSPCPIVIIVDDPVPPRAADLPLSAAEAPGHLLGCGSREQEIFGFRPP